MKFAFLLYGDEDEWAAMPEAQQHEIIGAHVAFTQALRDAKAYVSGAPLDHPRGTKRVRNAGGAARIEDGPFTDAKEQLGGYYMVEAKDLDEALDWAARCPAASYGSIEVRPVWDVAAERK